MKIKNFLFGTILVVGLVGFLVIPSVVFAEFNLFGFSKEENPQTFSELETKNILKKLSDGLFEKWMWLKTDIYSTPKETTIFSFLKQAINYDVWNYLFQDLPIDVSIRVGKALAEVVQIITSDNAMKLAIEKLERDSVKMSVDYLKQELFKYEAKTAFGATKVKYDTGKTKIETSFQYIMVYVPIDDKKGNIIVRMYSPYEIEPPATSASYGLATGFINDLNPGEKIPPFIVEFKGVIGNKSFSWDYQWYSEPEIRVYFSQNIPDFGFKSVPWYDKYIINPIKKTVNGIVSVITGLISKGETVEYLVLEESNTPNEEAKQEAKEMLSQVNNYNNYEVPKTETKEEAKQVALKEIETIIKKEEPKEEPKQEPKKDCLLNNNNPKRNRILINEVAWMGSLNSANDEWIELKNISSSEINLKNWSLYDKDKQINILIEKDLFIPSQGFVLFERTDDNSVPFIKADQVYVGTISNSSESLYLFNPICELEDFVEANSSWPAGNSKERLTMEREANLTWHDYNGLGYMNIFGTPRQENSAGSTKKIENTTTNTITTTSTSGGGGGGGGGGVSISYCSQSNLNNPLLSPIIINEVAWMGTEESSSDEWIELKNISGESINMNGWQLLDKDNQIKVIFNSSDIISSNDFYLLERTDDGTVPNILANKIYSGALSDKDESLRLFNNNCELVDYVVAEESWPGGNNLKRTMERDDINWHTYSSLNKDEVSGLWGTPKKENSERIEEENKKSEEEYDEDEEKEETEENKEDLIVPTSLMITEIGLDDNEYVEIFNQTEEDINLCLNEDNCYYISYYANATTVRSWNNPNYNWRFPEGLIINANSYILIDIYGDSGGDFKAGNYSSQKLSNNSGSIALFSNDPTSDEEDSSSQLLKVDAFAWKKESNSEPEVREGNAFIVNNEKILGRKYYSGKYIDSDNNLNDFEGQKQNLKTHPSFPPEAVNISVFKGETKNSVILSWIAPFDVDTKEEDLDYDVFYSLNKEINADDLIQINDYTNTEIKKQENNVSVLISDLYYDSIYYFAVKAKDKELNYSDLSNSANYSISKAEHIKPFYYIDFGMRNKSSLSGPTYDNFIETDVFIKGEDTTTLNDEFSLPIIDENENIYTSGRLDGKRGVFVFDKKGNKKWEYECLSQEKMFLSSKGTLYFFCSEKLIALSPSGKLKWQEDFNNSYNGQIFSDSNEKIYIINNSGNSVLYVVEDKGEAKINSYDFGKHYESFSNIVADESGNVYFFAENNLFKFNGHAKMGERLVEILYEDDYEGEKDKIGRVNDLELVLTLNNVLIFNLSGAKHGNSGKVSNTLYAIDKNNINADFIWFKEDKHYRLIGVNGDEFFVQSNLSADYGWYHLYLYSLDVLTGEENWNKHWAANGSSPGSTSFIVSDSNNNIYFNKSGQIKAYNSNKITDDDPQNDIIFSLSGLGYYSAPVSLGKEKMYFIHEGAIKRVIFNP